jgi:hypothetical protein
VSRAYAIPELDAPRLVRYGLPDLYYATSPAAGATYSETIGGSFYTRLVGVYVQLVTSSTTADRYVSIEYLDEQSNVIFASGPAVAVTASATQLLHFSPLHYESAWPVGSHVISPLAPLLLYPLWKWRIQVLNIDTTDQLSKIRVVRERFYTTTEPDVVIPE